MSDPSPLSPRLRFSRTLLRAAVAAGAGVAVMVAGATPAAAAPIQVTCGSRGGGDGVKNTLVYDPEILDGDATLITEALTPRAQRRLASGYGVTERFGLSTRGLVETPNPAIYQTPVRVESTTKNPCGEFSLSFLG